MSAAAKSIDEQARAGQLTANVQSGAQTALTQAQELGTTGWGMLSTLATGVVANVRKLAGDEEDGAAAGATGDSGIPGNARVSDGDWGGFEDTDSGAGTIALLQLIVSDILKYRTGQSFYKQQQAGSNQRLCRMSQ